MKTFFGSMYEISSYMKTFFCSMYEISSYYDRDFLIHEIFISWQFHDPYLEECPLSKEELLRLVEEEAALRISASFLEQVGQGVVSNTFIISNRPR